MSDFSELCPLFNTGVFNEVTFPGPMPYTAVLTGINLLAGTSAATKDGYFTFGRTVVVTKAWIRKTTGAPGTVLGLNLLHKTSGTAALTGTIFGSITISVSAGDYEVGYGWQPFTDFSEKTFTSDEVLSLQIAAGLTVDGGGGGVELMVRYREK
jgi:hypothetical protein